ncbi:hypothetical protein BM1_00035 [Bipolaris maydis]|nr:hypothetical protein BM1_00035 [Bipolaris maydis]KAJ6284261.1 hypothetical protein J3E71DRAFT_238914 [Bipolaris maydis]
MSYIDRLPIELALEVTRYLPQPDVAAFVQASKNLFEAEEALYKAIKLVYQTSPKVLSLVRFLQRYPFFTSVTRAIEINAAVLESGDVHELSYEDLDEARHLTESLVQLRATSPSTLDAVILPEDTKKKWLLAWMSETGYLSACLAWIIFKAENLEVLQLDMSRFQEAAMFFDLFRSTYSTGLAHGHQPFAHLQRLEITLSTQDAFVPLVSTLTEVVVTRPGTETVFGVPSLRTSDATSLRSIHLRGSLNGARLITELLRTGAPPNLEEICIRDDGLFSDDESSNFFDTVFQTALKIKTLVLTFRYKGDDFDLATIIPPNAHQLETVTYFGIHQWLLPDVGPDLDLQQLKRSVPPNVKELEIQGLNVDAIRHVVDNHRDSEFIPMNIPDQLNTLHLSFDVDAEEFDSPTEKLADIMPALRTLSRQLRQSRCTLLVCVRKRILFFSEEKVVFKAKP